jgi:hypothetical protein
VTGSWGDPGAELQGQPAERSGRITAGEARSDPLRARLRGRRGSVHFQVVGAVRVDEGQLTRCLADPPVPPRPLPPPQLGQGAPDADEEDVVGVAAPRLPRRLRLLQPGWWVCVSA